MNETINGLFARKSVRAFTEKEISKYAKTIILQSAMEAPTAGNQQMYTVIDVESQEQKERLSVLCDNQPFIAKAKAVFVFCADFCKWYDAFIAGGCNPRKPGVGDLMLAVSDSCIAAQNAVVAAESLGIGSCYIGDIMENCEAMRKCLELPEYVFPCAMLVMGYPTEQQINRTKPGRCELSDIVCTDTYKRKDDTALKKMFSSKCGERSFEEWAKAFCDRKYNSDFSKEMSRSVGEYIKQFSDKKEYNFENINFELKSMIDGVSDTVSNLANASALLWDNMTDINWAGFYIIKENILILGPFQGKVACTSIEIGQGVCGTAVAEDKTQVVPDVHSFPGHIPCDNASNSEIVVPIRKNGTVVGVIDIDSPVFNRFTDEDKNGLEIFAGIISGCF